ncbi:MAG TPA: (Fe-S)-binding protein [Anaerolineales bacterium]
MKKEAQLFITCIVDTLYPQVGEAVVRTLRRAGVQVGFPSGQTCCGQPAFNAGMRPQAKQMARHTIQTLESTGGWVVLPSGSCTAMIRHGYLELFADDPEWLPRAQALSERTYELTEFLVDVLGIQNVKARFGARVTYHASCHLLRDLGVAVQPRQLLSAVEDLDFVELPHYEECCGFGGVFALEHARISGAMLARKIAHIDATGAELVVSCDAGCITNMNGGLHRQGKSSRAIHIAQILDHA